MKGVIRIGGAALVGVFIVLAAVRAQNAQTPDASAGVVVVPREARTYIETVDSDGDGTKDWQESLEGRVLAEIQLPTTTLTEKTETYTPPTTFTGKFSEAFLQDYLQGKIRGEDFSDPSAFVERAAETIDVSSQSKQHLRSELTLEPTTDTGTHAYGNAIAQTIVTRPVRTADAPLLLKQALDTSDPEKLTPLHVAQGQYEEIVLELLDTPVPLSFSQEHLNLINAYESLVTDLAAMQLSFTDPLYAFARVKKYEDDVRILIQTLTELSQRLKQQGASYTAEEFGIFFDLYN